MSSHKIIKMHAPRSPIGSDDESEISITLLPETPNMLKETLIEHKKISIEPMNVNKQEEEPEEPKEEEPEEPEAPKEEEEPEDLDDNIKDFIVLCTHKYLYKQEVPSLSSNKRRQRSMEIIIARHVDSICEAFKYIS